MRTTDEEATEFFTRHRTVKQLRALTEERYVWWLREAAREAQASRFDTRRREARTARARPRLTLSAPRADVPRVRVGAVLPAPATGPYRNATTRAAAERAAHRFFTAVDGTNPAHEAQYTHFRELFTLEREALMLRFDNAPIDPITPAEYAAVTTMAVEARRRRRVEAEEAREYHRRHGDVHPAGLTIEQVEAIAHRVYGAD